MNWPVVSLPSSMAFQSALFITMHSGAVPWASSSPSARRTLTIALVWMLPADSLRR